MRLLIQSFSILVILSLAIANGATPPSQDALPESTFTREPYVEYLNAKAKEIYDTICAESAGMAHDHVTLKAGDHRIVIKGREADARLESLWIGSVGATPGSEAGRFLDLGKASITAPMAMQEFDGKRTLVGAQGGGSATVPFHVDRDGEYVIWGKACGPSARSDSFYVALDGARPFTWDIPTDRRGKCTWRRVAPRGPSYYSAYNFLLAFAAASPHGARRTDAAFRETALALSHAALEKRATIREKSQQLWFIGDLEAIRLWQLDPDTPEADLDGLLEGVRRYLDKCHGMATTHEGWRDNTPNIQIQAACLLQVGATMWEKRDPDTSRKWAETAQECLDRAWQYKIPGGPFGYSYDSGVDAGYFANDAKYLGRYYMLTGDSRVESALRDMASFARNTTAFGHPISFSSPWWKHTFHGYNRSGQNGVPEIILALTKDPVLARVVELNRERRMRRPYSAKSDYVLALYNIMQPDLTCAVAPIADAAWFSPIENGPALRQGSLNVAMPLRPWCESTCGATWSTPDDVVSQVCSVILTAITPDAGSRRAKAHFPVAYSVVERHPAPDTRTVVCGDGFIASATSFRPALGGPALPQFADEKNESPWQRTDIYFADSHGVAGFLELRALRDNNSSRVVLWTHASDNLKIEGNTVRTPGLTVHLEEQYGGRLTNLGPTWGFAAGVYPLDLVEAPVAEGGASGFRKGQTFRTTVAIAGDSGASGLRVGPCEEADGVYRIAILREGQPYAHLVANLSDAAASWSPDQEQSDVWQSANDKGKTRSVNTSSPIALPPHSMTVARD